MDLNNQKIIGLSQREALTNELKGTLFEFLVASAISRKFNIESKFLSQIDQSLMRVLKNYEYWLRESNPELLRVLPGFAFETAKEIIKRLPGTINQIYLLGKGIKAGKKNGFKETDIAILSDGLYYPFSLKLSKSNAFINTKSGGVRTFLSKYFLAFKSSQILELELNKIVDMSFIKMGSKLYQLAGLDFQNKFCSKWKELGHPDLPGQLNPEMKKIVQNYYYEVINYIYDVLNKFYLEDKNLLVESLLPLLGMGDNSLIQVTCLHDKIKKSKSFDSYSLNEVYSLDSEFFKKSLESVHFKNNNETSSFTIELNGLALQIRVKPMNKFTVPGLKINCSVKMR